MLEFIGVRLKTNWGCLVVGIPLYKSQVRPTNIYNYFINVIQPKVADGFKFNTNIFILSVNWFKLIT